MIGVARMKRMPPSRLCQLGGAGSTRSTISGREIGKEHERRQNEHRDPHRVDGLGPDRKEQAPDRRARDRRRLARDRAHRQRAGQEVDRNELGYQRAPRRVADRRQRSGHRRKRDELPELARAADRHEEQQRHDGRVGEAPDDHDGNARQPVGKLTRRQRQQRHGRELREPDQAEVERAVVDQVDLPADRHRDHLHREARRQHRRPEPAEVAVLEGGRERDHSSNSASSVRLRSSSGAA